MHLLFLDQSGTPSDHTFALGGVAVRGDRWAEVRDLRRTARDRHGWPPDEEAKWHGIRSGEVPRTSASFAVTRRSTRRR